MPKSIKSLCLFSVFLALSFNQTSIAQKFESEVTVKVKANNRTYVGTPLLWENDRMKLLRRDGRLSTIPVESEDDYKVIAQYFSVMSPEDMISKLKREFGKRYSVSSTPSFVVVHPHGNYKKYVKPFEDLNRRFETYFFKRGHHLEEARFPMVAIVLNTKDEYKRMVTNHHPNMIDSVGYYSLNSNRIITYDRTREESESFFQNNTLIHEATHQTAYNRGIHNRFANRSSWVVEGLANMFEAEGVYDSDINTKREDRVNRGELYWLQRAIKDGTAKGTLEKIVRSDDLLRSNTHLAYQYAWGLTFYLAETKSRAYIKFLADDAQRPNYSAYGSKERVERFAEAFGSDFANFEARMFKFLMKQKVKLPPGYR